MDVWRVTSSSNLNIWTVALMVIAELAGEQMALNKQPC